MDSDGFKDYAISAPSYFGISEVHVYSGNDGSLLWSTEGGPIPEFMGFEKTQPLGDVNGDIYSDFSITVQEVSVQTGQTWHFQMWYRDIGRTSNFTNTMSIDWS